MDNKDDIQKALLSDVEKRAQDIADQLDDLANQIKWKKLTAREALSKAFIMGVKI